MRALPRRVTIARRNLELCFKALPAKEREKLLIKNFESVGMGVLETRRLVLVRQAFTQMVYGYGL